MIGELISQAGDVVEATLTNGAIWTHEADEGTMLTTDYVLTKLFDAFNIQIDDVVKAVEDDQTFFHVPTGLVASREHHFRGTTDDHQGCWKNESYIVGNRC